MNYSGWTAGAKGLTSALDAYAKAKKARQEKKSKASDGALDFGASWNQPKKNPYGLTLWGG